MAGASFRNAGEIIALAGCDRLTISPNLLEELSQTTEIIPRVLDPCNATYIGEKLKVDEESFHREMNANVMASEKLKEGIQGFSQDTEKLEILIKEKLENKTIT